MSTAREAAHAMLDRLIAKLPGPLTPARMQETLDCELGRFTVALAFEPMPPHPFDGLIVVALPGGVPDTRCKRCGQPPVAPIHAAPGQLVG
jgi:hypothetical protein